jgi:spermidine synthase
LTLFVTLAFGVSGFISIAYEIIWTRYLALFLANSIYAASTILTVFLIGLGLGSLLFARFLGRRKRLLTTFGVFQLGIGGSAVLLTPALLALGSPLGMGAPTFVASQTFCLALMIVPTTLMGALLPLVCRIVVQRVDHVGHSVGAVYAVNTVGAVLGALVGGLVLAPRLGIGGSVVLLAAGNGLMGLAALAFEPSPRRWQVSIGGTAALAIVAFPALGWPPIPQARLAQIAGPSERIIDVREGLMGTVWVTENTWHEKALWVDTSVMGRIPRPRRQAFSAQRVQGHIPLLLHGGQARSVLGIGFGTGQTFGAQLQYPIERLDVVDISRAVVELGTAHFREHMSGFDTDSRARVIVDDGRSYVTRTREKYDVITLEMPPHTEVGIVHFYTTDFYELLRKRLRPGGLVAQWMPIYNLTPAEARGVVRSFIEVFPEAALWYNSTNLLLLGWEDKFVIHPSSVRSRLGQPAIARDLAVSYTGDPSVSLHELEAVLAGFLMGPDALARFAQEAPLYTDDQPELEFSWIEFPASGPERSDMLIVENARQIAAHQEGIAPHLGEPLDAAVLERIRHIRRSYVGHLFAIGYDNLATRAAAQGMVDEALRLYDEAIRAQPWFAQAHYNLGNLHVRLGKAEEALEIHQRAARLAPDLAEVQFAIAFDLHQLGRLQDSAEAYRAAIAIHSDFADAYLNLARVEFQRGRSDEALAAIRALLARDPAHAEAHRLLAELQAPTRE